MTVVVRSSEGTPVHLSLTAAAISEVLPVNITSVPPFWQWQLW